MVNKIIFKTVKCLLQTGHILLLTMYFKFSIPHTLLALRVSGNNNYAIKKVKTMLLQYLILENSFLP